MEDFMKKYKLGYTSGVYDLFHIGHLNILSKAKEQCEYLIVAVSTDELVVEYKKKKPIIPFDERIAIVSAIKFADEVVAQESLSKVEAWHKYNYNALFGGSDWAKNDTIIEAEQQLKPKGVDIVLFPYTQSTSSTLLSEVLYRLQEEK